MKLTLKLIVLSAVVLILAVNVFAQFLVTSHDPHHDRTPEALRAIGWKSVPAQLLAQEVMPSEEIKKFVKQVSAEKLMQLTAQITHFGDRSAGSNDNVAATRFIKNYFESAAGLKAEERCFLSKGAQICNVLARKPGRTSDVILVLAHLDTVGFLNAGADDNASGAAGLLLMAEYLKNVSLEKTVWFLATNGEEDGLLGSEQFKSELLKSGEMKLIKHAINMDMISWNSDGIVDIETNKEFGDFAQWMAQNAQFYTTLTPHLAMPAWGSDHVPFIKAGIPTVLTIEHWDTKTPCYHKSCDTMDDLNMKYAAEIIKLNLAAVLQL